jgi:isoleucyl-tRNA synthetase
MLTGVVVGYTWIARRDRSRKKLGFTNKQQIEEYGIEKFNKLCKESAFSYIQEWRS